MKVHRRPTDEEVLRSIRAVPCTVRLSAKQFVQVYSAIDQLRRDLPVRARFLQRLLCKLDQAQREASATR